MSKKQPSRTRRPKAERKRVPARPRTARAAGPTATAKAPAGTRAEADAPVERPDTTVAAGASGLDRLVPPLTIVGVGMSAGGLDACSQMLEALPSDPGFALVLIQHLAPHFRSALPALLATHALMHVEEAEDGMAVEANHVYVIPPDVQIELVDGKLGLRPRPASQGHLLPVNFFFDSLARVQGSRAVAVLLSGTGSDGAEGIRAVKEAGGRVFVQAPDTAKYDGMPRAAIATGVVDQVLPPREIAHALVEVMREGIDDRSLPEPQLPDFSDSQFDEIISRLHAASGVDFRHYKQPTLKRRILRRMALVRANDPAEYVAYLQAHADEVRLLYQDILIHVTRFFREPESFDTLVREVFPKLIEGRKPDNPLRMWVAGCATGEEAYSLAISLLDFLGQTGSDFPIQIFGTDVSETAIEQARQGLYPTSIAEDVPREKLRRFFTRVDAGYRISKGVRDLCVFARQDLTRDPPFSKLDLVLCRNVLIYLDTNLQRRVIPIFHYALRPNGFLVLGQAETVGPHVDLFALVDKKHKIYRKKESEHALAPTVSLGTYTLPNIGAVVPAPSGEYGNDPRLAQNEANRVVLDRYGPPGVLVNQDLDILQFRGRTGAYLEPPPGEASLSLLKLAREGLLHGLRSALQSVRKTRKPVRKEGLRVRSNGGWCDVDLQVIPITSMPTLHYLVLFEEPRRKGRAPAKLEPGAGRREKDSPRSARLEQELAATREYLQSIIQEVEAANEELQSANEEILSSNEELQSTNEELDTAKEELQSTNEELNTLNDELHARNEELTRVNSDLVNLLGSVNIAIVIVTNDLRIRRFTPMAEKMLNLIPSDVGRPITQVKPNVDVPNLGELIMDVVDNISAVEREVHDEEGRGYLLRIRPYKGVENRIEGAVIALFEAEAPGGYAPEEVRATALAEAVMETTGLPMVVMEPSGRVRALNRAFCEAFGVSKPEAEGRSLYELQDRRWDVAALHEAIEHLDETGGVERLRMDHQPAGGSVTIDARAILPASGAARLVLLAFEAGNERQA